uniref:Uncharacterized protein n=1 Tax=Molossus molossus TaxID=27622 RepID=A0A7J8FAE7_MOLMO|nr:hypothetical protein HJG59_008485 [Molossus molossus]
MTTWKTVALLLSEKDALVCFPVGQLSGSRGDGKHVNFKGVSLEKKVLSVEVLLSSGAAVGSSCYPEYKLRVFGIWRRPPMWGGEKIKWQVQDNFTYFTFCQVPAEPTAEIGDEETATPLQASVCTFQTQQEDGTLTKSNTD